MSWFFVINPGSQHTKGAQFIPVLLAALSEHKLDFAYKLTGRLEDACRFSREANEEGFETIVAVGGDGTINGVINGFYDTNGKRISKAKLGVIHTGTSPDFCRSYGIPVKSESALSTLLRGNTKEISVAKIDYHSATGDTRTGFYACCASLGVGAQVAQRSNSNLRKYLGDALGTFTSIIISLCGYKVSDLNMVCDGKEVVIKDNLNTFIGKTAFIASGLKVAHNLTPDDNRLYVLSMKRLNLLNIFPALRTIYSGQPFTSKDYISLDYAGTIEVKNSRTSVGVEFDGDPQGYLPCRISIAPDKLELIADE